MWGLDTVDPRVAIAAMQAMNASVRNAVFAPAFFGTPLILLITSAAALVAGARASAVWFALGGVIYAGGGLILTMMINVPMNEALALIDIPQDIEAAQMIWSDYSPDWQYWNTIRTFFSGIALALCGLAFLRLPAPNR